VVIQDEAVKLVAVAVGGSNVPVGGSVGVGTGVGVLDDMGTEVKVGDTLVVTGSNVPVFSRDAGVVVASDTQLVRRSDRNKKKIV
jgi:hypothetical protein